MPRVRRNDSHVEKKFQQHLFPPSRSYYALSRNNCFLRLLLKRDTRTHTHIHTTFVWLARDVDSLCSYEERFMARYWRQLEMLKHPSWKRR